jgi:thioredoxin 1
MKNVLIVVVLLAAIGAVIAAKQFQSTPESRLDGSDTKLPRLLELGSDSCIPCKEMKPIIDGLEVEYAGLMKVVFVDIWENESIGEKYGIDKIPTQIFFDADGKELFRHEGFYSKESIMAKWKEHGIEFRIELTEVK